MLMKIKTQGKRRESMMQGNETVIIPDKDAKAVYDFVKFLEKKLKK